MVKALAVIRTSAMVAHSVLQRLGVLTRQRSCSKQHGFTFTELTVVLALIGLLTLVLLSARADSRPKSQSVRCMDNLRQVMGAIMMYTRDNHDLFPPNPGDANTIPGHNWCQGTAGVGGSAQFNPDLLADPS